MAEQLIFATGPALHRHSRDQLHRHRPDRFRVEIGFQSKADSSYLGHCVSASSRAIECKPVGGDYGGSHRIGAVVFPLSNRLAHTGLRDNGRKGV